MVNASGGASPSAPTKYGDCSSVGRVEDCGSFGHGFDPHHSPRKYYGAVADVVIASDRKSEGVGS